MSAGALTVEPLDAASEAAWDAYVRARPEATPFHLLAWRRVVAQGLGHRPHYLVARRDGAITGVLPLFHLASIFFGAALVSVPAAVGGGPLSSDEESRRQLVDAARALGERLRVGYVELRCERSLQLGLAETDLYVTFRADLTAGEKALLSHMDRKRRQMLACAERGGLRGRFAGPEELPRFYALFCHSMRAHGTPVYSQRYLATLLREYASESFLYLVEQDGRPVGGTIGFDFRGTVLPFYAGADRSHRPRGLDEHLYWSLMRWGIENGRHTFDFGRSRRGTGAYAFKARWGMTEVPFAYQYCLLGRGEVPRVGPANPRYAPLIAAWRHLPLALTRLVGPPLVRRVP